MKYDFRVWNSQDNKNPENIEANETGLIDQAKNLLTTNNGDSDIIIDTEECGEGAITSAKISFFYAKAKAKDSNNKETEVLIDVTEKRYIKMVIKGNLYLPVNSLGDTVKFWSDKDLKKRSTLLVAEWAQITPEKDKYYRYVELRIIMKAGDFRAIAANNMYINNYEEDYTNGECGTFHLELLQKIDENSALKLTE